VPAAGLVDGAAKEGGGSGRLGEVPAAAWDRCGHTHEGGGGDGQTLGCQL